MAARFTTIWFILIVMCSVAISQVGPPGTGSPKPIMADGNNNESAKANLDWLAQKAREDETVIAIARRGDKEFSHKLSEQRLQTVRLYLVNTRGMSKERLVTAEGETVRGFGRVEIYVGGKLFMVFTLARNKNFASQG